MRVMNILLAYYSRSGHTEEMAKAVEAELIRQGYSVDIEKVEPQKEYSFHTWWWLRTFLNTTKIKELKIKSAKGYDLVLIGSPNWTRLSLPMTSYLKTLKGLKHKSVALFSTTALWPNLEWYVFSSYLLDFTFEKAVEKAGGIPVDSFPTSSIAKSMSITSRYGRKNLKSFCESLNFAPVTYKNRTITQEIKGTNRFLVIFFTLLILGSLGIQLLFKPLAWSSYGYLFLILFLTLYIIVITAQYQKLLFIARYISSFSLIVLWLSLVSFLPGHLAPLIQYGNIVIIIFTGIFRDTKIVIHSGSLALVGCIFVTLFIIPQYLDPSMTRISVLIIVIIAVTLITRAFRKKYIESIELEAELKASNIKIKESDQAKGAFISIASHNLRTPLVKLNAFFQELQKGCLKSKEQKMLYNVAKEGLIDLSVLSEGLLSIASIEGGTIKIQKSCVNLSRLISRVAEDVKLIAGDRHITIENNIRVSEVFVDGEETKLSQAIYNVLENAVKYNRDRGRITLNLMVNDQRKEVIFSVTDTGLGIPDGKKQSIFTRFSKGDIYKYDNKGVGLGLYLTKLIVVAHNGRVWFHSKEKEGSTFYISLPLAKKNVAKEAPIPTARV